jgi:RNA polymerase-binding transcription factor DksA
MASQYHSAKPSTPRRRKQMGEIADMMLDGTLCEWCGEYIDDGKDAGYARLCAGCQEIKDREGEKEKPR